MKTYKVFYRTSTDVFKPFHKTNDDPQVKHHVRGYLLHPCGRTEAYGIFYTHFDTKQGGLRHMTEEEAFDTACRFNAEEGWKAGDQVNGEHIELQG